VLGVLASSCRVGLTYNIFVFFFLDLVLWVIDFVLRTLNLLSLLNNKCYKYEKVIKKKKTKNEKKKKNLKNKNIKKNFYKIIKIIDKKKFFFII